ncbi:MAG TPA: response regulator [Vicinamibacterales bacterium]|jgi:DNA-binding response OmpR family regulator
MKHIIIIEDNALAASIYQAALKQEGFTVEVASDGEAGLGAIARERPDLVLLDLMLPKVEGAEILRRIRSTPGLTTVPVVVTSNAYTATRLDDLWKAGATQIVTKASISPKNLAKVVRDALAALPPKD